MKIEILMRELKITNTIECASNRSFFTIDWHEISVNSCVKVSWQHSRVEQSHVQHCVHVIGVC